MKQYLAYIVPLVFIIIFWLRYRGGREVTVSAWRMAASGGLIFIFIGIAFAVEPRHAIATRHWLTFVGATAVGSLIGVARAKSFEIRRVGDTVVMRTSSIAVVFLALLLLVRSVLRQNFVEHSVIALDASLIFASFMVLSQRLTIWLRVRNLRQETRMACQED